MEEFIFKKNLHRKTPITEKTGACHDSDNFKNSIRFIVWFLCG